MIGLIPISVGDGEPAGCVRCRPEPEASYLPVDAIASSLAGMPGTDGVALTGPEPFAHPELPRVVAACRTLGVPRIAIETDGGALSVTGNALGVLRSGVRHLWIRVLGADSGSHDARAGHPGLFSAMKAGVNGYIAAAEAEDLRVTVTAIVPVCVHNLEELPAIVAACAAHGFHAARLTAAGPLPAVAEAIVAAACDTGMVNRLWVCTDGSLPLPASHRLHVEADGGVAAPVPDPGSGDGS